jgi:hypothetical protein
MFEGKIKNGHFMEYIPGIRAVVYDALGNEIHEMKPPAIHVEIPNGQSTVRFSGKTESGDVATVHVTIRTIGKPLPR